MPAIPVEFMGETYKTKTEFYNYIKGIIYKIDICDSVKVKYPEYYNILCELFKFHIDYINKTDGMIDIKIQNNAMNSGLETIIIKESPKNNIDISWNSCAHLRFKNEINHLNDSLRSRISDQIIHFRCNNSNKCVKCGEVKSDMHVDHIIQFEELKGKFLKICFEDNISIPKQFSELTDGTNRSCFRPEDSEFSNKWYEYHKEHATLRILCKNCNLTRRKYKQ